MELHLDVHDDYFMETLKRSLNTNNTGVIREALTILNWAVQEKLKGRLILSSNNEGGNVVRLEMASLNNVRNPLE